MRVRELKNAALRKTGNGLLGVAVQFLCATLRVELVNCEKAAALLEENKSFIVAFWHGAMLYPWYFYRNRKMLGLTSYSKDGEMLARTLKRWNYTVVRGSSSKGGNIALGILVDFARHEGGVALTPDGPRGPLHEFKAGAVVAAKKSGAPLILLGAGYKNCKRLRSWDQFQIPFPFSKVRLVFSDPIYVESEMPKPEVSDLIKDCERNLKKLQIAAGAFN